VNVPALQSERLLVGFFFAKVNPVSPAREREGITHQPLTGAPFFLATV
jgi:hypothetical protein